MSALKKLSKFDCSVADELKRYGRLRRFSPSLLESAASTLLKSIHYGDGMIWSDSLLVNCLNESETSIRSLFDRFPGYRTSLISTTKFRETLSTAHLNIQPSFQTPLDDELLYNLRYFGGDLTEERVLEVELMLALFEYKDRQASVAGFVSHISRPILDFSSGCKREEDRRQLIRMHYFLEDVVCLALMAGVHPLRSLSRAREDSTVVGVGRGCLVKPDLGVKENFNKARRMFYWQLRDAAKVDSAVLPDVELERLATAFSLDEFQAALEFEDSIGEEIDYEERPAAEELRERFYLAAARLWDSGIPISLLVERLDQWRQHSVDSSWPLSHKILLSIGHFDISAAFLDVGTEVSLDPQKSLNNSLANVGIWVPSPTWSDSVLERFAGMLARAEPEQAFQRLFEAYPDFILDELHIEAFPQVFLFQESTGNPLRVDFAVRRTGSRVVDLIELKRPDCKLLTGTESRPVLTRAAAAALAQLKEYRDWFRVPDNRRWFRERYGMDGFEPRLTLVIGRSDPAMSPDVWAKATSGAEGCIVTYDEILRTALGRRRWSP